jgi:hypothetical protein
METNEINAVDLLAKAIEFLISEQDKAYFLKQVEFCKSLEETKKKIQFNDGVFHALNTLRP